MKGRKVLLIDDDEDDIVFLEEVLSGHEIEVATARDGEAGLKRAKADRPDLIVLGVQMPKKDGFATLHELKESESTADIPVIMLTGVAAKTGVRFSASDMADFLGVEPDAYVEKPYEAARILYVIEQFLRPPK